MIVERRPITREIKGRIETIKGVVIHEQVVGAAHVVPSARERVCPGYLRLQPGHLARVRVGRAYRFIADNSMAWNFIVSGLFDDIVGVDQVGCQVTICIRTRGATAGSENAGRI